ncbi:MAG: DHA2 family efflux MFS transporter permease subunit [Pseudomonadota bacterium]
MNNQSHNFSGMTLVLLTISLSLGIFMNVLDVSIANVAIPTIAGNMGVSADEGTWIITSFSVSMAIVLPLTGWLARRFGEIKLFLFSTALFTLASLLCGLSFNLPMLIFFRVLQGAVAAPMIPLSQSILLASYPEDKKGFATSLWAMTAVVAPICGPIIGGWLTDNYTWPWIFYINIPVGIISVSVTAIILAGRETPLSKPPIDAIGLTLLIIGVGCLQVLLDKGHDLDWFNSNVIVALGVVSFVALAFLIVWELTDGEPIIDLWLFKGRNFAIGSIALCLGFTVYFANVVIFPLWLQTQMGYTPTWAGLAAAPVGIFPVLFTPIIGLLINKVDLRLMISFGFLAFAISSFWSGSFDTNVSYYKLIQPRLVQGIGIAFFFTPLVSVVISGLPRERIASALGLANFMRILGGSFGTSLSVTLWNDREALHHSQLVEQINHFNPISLDALRQLENLGFSHLQSYQMIVRTITSQAFMLSTNDFFWLAGWIFVILLGIVWFAKPPFVSKMSSPTVD